MRIRIAIVVAMLLLVYAAGAQTPVSPRYFGPNAFQVPQSPELMFGGGDESIKVEIAGDFIRGRLSGLDNTSDVHLKLSLPLFTDRARLTVWWEVHEWYKMDDGILKYRGSVDNLITDHTAGPLFVSTEILLLKERKTVPCLIVRSVLRTASETEDAFPDRRGYDSAGYFFDVLLGKTIGPVSVSASTGFLCWQTGDGSQNDAVMFSVDVSCTPCSFLKASAQFGGYVGWRNDGDFPMSLRLRTDFGKEKWLVKPFAEYRHGFKDWPFDMFRVGVAANIRL